MCRCGRSIVGVSTMEKVEDCQDIEGLVCCSDCQSKFHIGCVDVERDDDCGSDENVW